MRVFWCPKYEISVWEKFERQGNWSNKNGKVTLLKVVLVKGNFKIYFRNVVLKLNHLKKCLDNIRMPVEYLPSCWMILLACYTLTIGITCFSHHFPQFPLANLCACTVFQRMSHCSTQFILIICSSHLPVCLNTQPYCSVCFS